MPDEATVQFTVDITPDGRVVLDFMRRVDHAKIPREDALELAQTIVEAVRSARAGFRGDINRHSQGHIRYVVGSTQDGRVLLDFRGTPIYHLAFASLHKALDCAEALAETANQIAIDGPMIEIPAAIRG